MKLYHFIYPNQSAMAQRSPKSPKNESPPRQSFFFMFFVKSIKDRASSGQQTHHQLRFSIYKGSQMLNSTREPVDIVMLDGWAKPERLELPFLLKDAHLSHEIDFTIKVHRIQNEEESEVGEVKLKADKYTLAYIHEKQQKIEQVNTFGQYRVRYLIFTDRNRHNLQKIVRTYRNSQEYEQWAAKNEEGVENESKKEQIGQLILAEHGVSNDEVYEELVVGGDGDKEIKTPDKRQELEVPNQKNKDKQQSEVIEVTQTYPTDQNKVQTENNKLLDYLGQKQGQPQKQQINQAIQHKNHTEQINDLSQIKQKAEEKETSMKDSSLKKAGVKGSGYYDRKRQYYQPIPKEEEPQVQIPITISKVERKAVSHEEEPIENKLDQVSISVSQKVKKQGPIFESTDSILEDNNEEATTELSQVIETVGGEHGTIPDNKSSDWKLTLKILLFLIFVGLGAIYFIGLNKDTKPVKSDKKGQRVHTKSPKKSKKSK